MPSCKRQCQGPLLAISNTTFCLDKLTMHDVKTPFEGVSECHIEACHGRANVRRYVASCHYISSCWWWWMTVSSDEGENFHWTAGKVCLSIFLFLVAGLCEIGGGWATWQAVRGRFVPDGERLRSRITYGLLVVAALSLVGYGFIPTAQPPPNFGRLYAVYGGFFIVLSYIWGWAIDKDRPDKGCSHNPPWHGCFKAQLIASAVTTASVPSTLKSWTGSCPQGPCSLLVGDLQSGWKQTIKLGVEKQLN